MCPNFFGYTHGALYSGIQAAAQYLYERGLGPDPDTEEELSICTLWDDDDEVDESKMEL